MWPFGDFQVLYVCFIAHLCCLSDNNAIKLLVPRYYLSVVGCWCDQKSYQEALRFFIKLTEYITATRNIHDKSYFWVFNNPFWVLLPVLLKSWNSLFQHINYQNQHLQNFWMWIIMVFSLVLTSLKLCVTFDGLYKLYIYLLIYRLNN